MQQGTFRAWGTQLPPCPQHMYHAICSFKPCHSPRTVSPASAVGQSHLGSGAHMKNKKAALMSWTTLNLPLRPSAWLEKGCFLEGCPHRPHFTDTSRLLPAHHHTDACYTCATDHPTDHVLQSTIQHGAGVPGTSEGDRRREKLCPASLSPILQPKSHSSPLRHIAIFSQCELRLCASCHSLPGRPPAVVKWERGRRCLQPYN